MSEKIMIETQNLTKMFREVIAVNNISLTVKEGEFVSILGPSGCGKSTLLRMISGLESPTKGNIYLQGKLINNIKANKRPINMVFQSYALFPHLNVYENIAFGLNVKGVKTKSIIPRVKEMLSLVKLEGFEKRMPNELSGGQCQRVSLARALINEPLILLLDEPLGALDLKLRKAMQIELRSIQKKLGRTFIYVTHDQEEALVLSDRIMIMNNGKIIQTGSPVDVYKNPNTVFSSTFIGESNLMQGVLVSKSKENDEMVIKIDDLKIKTFFRDDAKVNDKFWILMRFENINISKDKKFELDNMFSGVIQNFIFLGPLLKYEVKISGLSKAISVFVGMNDSSKFFMRGDNVYLGWDKFASGLFSI